MWCSVRFHYKINLHKCPMSNYHIWFYQQRKKLFKVFHVQPKVCCPLGCCLKSVRKVHIFRTFCHLLFYFCVICLKNPKLSTQNLPKPNNWTIIKTSFRIPNEMCSEASNWIKMWMDGQWQTKWKQRKWNTQIKIKLLPFCRNCRCLEQISMILEMCVVFKDLLIYFRIFFLYYFGF